jgi:NAD(P)H dehydrogenase (quinone)
MLAIIGGTGKVGRTTIASLRRVGRPVRAVVRDQAKADGLVALGCEVAEADLRDTVALADALKGASAVQVIMPIAARAVDASAEMRLSIEAIGLALEQTCPMTVLAISDYGAQLPSGTGVTSLFHAFEQRLRRLPCGLIILRSAEHMENWARLLASALQSGKLPSLHHPLAKLFPTVSAFDVGAVAAELLLTSTEQQAPARIVHVEGPRRYTPADVATVVSKLTGLGILAYELPRSEWRVALTRGGLSEGYAELIIELYDAHNADRIDAEQGIGEIRRGVIGLTDALRPLLSKS